MEPVYVQLFTLYCSSEIELGKQLFPNNVFFNKHLIYRVSMSFFLLLGNSEIQFGLSNAELSSIVSWSLDTNKRTQLKVLQLSLRGFSRRFT